MNLGMLNDFLTICRACLYSYSFDEFSVVIRSLFGPVMCSFLSLEPADCRKMLGYISNVLVMLSQSLHGYKRTTLKASHLPDTTDNAVNCISLLGLLCGFLFFWLMVYVISVDAFVFQHFSGFHNVKHIFLSLAHLVFKTLSVLFFCAWVLCCRQAGSHVASVAIVYYCVLCYHLAFIRVPFSSS